MNPKENLIRSLQHKKPSWVPCPMIDASLQGISHNLREYSSKPGYDDWGVHWNSGKEKIGAGLPDEYPIKKPEDVYDYPLPDPEKSGLMDQALKKIKEIDRTRSLIIGDNGWGIFERAWFLVGMERLFCWMYDEPEAVSKLMNRIAKIKVKISERLIKEIGVDIIAYGDDWGSDKALLMSPKQWRKFIKPNQEFLYKVCLDNNVLIRQHSDGHVEEIIPDLVKIGLDILAIQPECNDFRRIKDRFGSQITFQGAVSSRTLSRGTPEEITREVKLRIKQLSKNGGYIIAPAHSISYSQSNIEAFKNAAIKYGDIPKKWIKL